MAKAKQTLLDTNSEVVDELHVANEDVDYTDVTGKDDLPEGVVDPKDDEDEPVKAKTAPAKKAAKVEPAGDDVPEELKGKTPAQLAKMYRDAQQVIGRQGSELGDLRRTADTYIKAHLTAAAKSTTPAKVEEVKAPDAVDFFTNPTDAVTRLVENHPALKKLEGENKAYAVREIQRHRSDSEREFNRLHPDATEILNDEGFRAWVVKSPIRKAMLLRAHLHYDLPAANEVLDTWKELRSAREQKAEDAEGKKPVAKSVAKKEAARVPSGGNAAPIESGAKGSKIYRRADIIRLMEQDPDRYQMMADEITKAYAEGRVR